MELSNEEKELYKRMGNNLATIRGGRSQDEIAKVLGIKTSNYNSIESKKGERHLRDFQLIKLAKYYNTSTDYLLGLSDVSTTDSELKAYCEEYKLDKKKLSALKGLNDSSLSALEIVKRRSDDFGLSAELNTINYLLEDLKENHSLSIISLISTYLYLDTNFSITKRTKMKNSDVPVNINLKGEIITSSFLKNIEEHLVEAREKIKKEGE